MRGAWECRHGIDGRDNCAKCCAPVIEEIDLRRDWVTETRPKQEPATWQERHIFDLTYRIQTLEYVVEAAEFWFEAITGGHFRDIARRQAILLEVIERYRARNK